MTRNTRKINWVKAALKDYSEFPKEAQDRAATAHNLCRRWCHARYSKAADRSWKRHWELAIKSRGDAYRVVYALQLGEDIWVVHAFQKKSKRGIATPKHEIDLVRERIKRLREQLR